jgi:hypothetical protein
MSACSPAKPYRRGYYITCRPSDKIPSRGFQGTVLKLMRAGDYPLTMTGRREITPHYLRLSFDACGMLQDSPLYPTMWIRMWFADGGKLHQRGYTLGRRGPHFVRPDLSAAAGMLASKPVIN